MFIFLSKKPMLDHAKSNTIIVITVRISTITTNRFSFCSAFNFIRNNQMIDNHRYIRNARRKTFCQLTELGKWKLFSCFYFLSIFFTISLSIHIHKVWRNIWFLVYSTRINAVLWMGLDFRFSNRINVAFMWI